MVKLLISENQFVTQTKYRRWVMGCQGKSETNQLRSGKSDSSAAANMAIDDLIQCGRTTPTKGEAAHRRRGG